MFTRLVSSQHGLGPPEREIVKPRIPRATLFDTEQRSLFCPSTGRTYQLSVALPPSYHTSDHEYPVVYLLDGDLLFGMAAGLTTVSHWCEGLPEIIVVGIGYGITSYTQWDQLRELDFPIADFKTQFEPSDPTGDPRPDLFLRALTESIVPDIDGAYRTRRTRRCLFGYSWGGFFTLYALFHQPDTFQHYLAGSPVLEIANDYLMSHDQRLRERRQQNRIHLYLSMGETEHDGLAAYHQFSEFLQHQRYPGLTLTAETYLSTPHGAEGTALSYLRGLRAVFRPNPL